jgi:hypothetical protein
MSWAVSLAEGSLGRGMKWMALVHLSTTVRIVLLPPSEKQGPSSLPGVETLGGVEIF